ncbi:zinc finger protein 501-like isoform X2 [Protopterus annectens]|uniref:zinc finger protein 501-like isoform X2 n=1 Tax=Protopterus annectens TaxID=7888 RepID=UPI001CFB7F92|nr:zinc finger protein 501-like isoform X2 [Protopterus annectens]
MNLEIPQSFEDVAVEFSREELKMLSEEEKKLYWEVMVQNFDHMVTVGYDIPVKHLLSFILKDKMLPSGDSDVGPPVQQKQLPGNRISTNRNADFTVIQNLQLPHKKPLEVESTIVLPDKMSVTRQDSVQSETRHNCKESTDRFIKKPELEMNLQTQTGEMPCSWPDHSSSVTFHSNNLSDQLHCSGQKKDTFQRHEQIFSREKLYKCVTCGKGFTTRKTLAVHMNIHTRQKLYRCPMCDKSFTQRSYIIAHQRIHSGQRPYKCSVCDKRFRQKGAMVLHEYIHTGQKPYKCNMCDKSFTQKSFMVYHQRIHSGQKPYTCSVCDKRFTRKNTLVLHHQIHTGQKPYKCTMCEKSFTQKANMVNHQLIHTGEKPYKCSMCDKSFNHKYSMKSHQRIHSEEKSYKCSMCDKSFKWKSSVVNHQRTHTRDEIKAEKKRKREVVV